MKMRPWAMLALLWILMAYQVAPAREWQLGPRNGDFAFTPVHGPEDWERRRTEIEQRVLIAAGLWPMPERTPLKAVIHGRIDRGDYTIDRVFFQSLPGHFVTGSLYLPKRPGRKMPGFLSPHGHWPGGRFMDLGAGAARTRAALESGAELHEPAARSVLQARCVQLARMGGAVFLYDMLGYGDSLQFPSHRHGTTKDGFQSVAADLRLQTMFGLQTWNSVRALDFLLTLDGIDPSRIGITGGSGGGTQTMMLSAIDQRIAASFPAVMPSTAKQGGCTCENSHYLRINQGNIDIAAATAPRPLGVTSADDFTKNLASDGLPDLRRLYTMLGVPENLTAHIAIEFTHNYNLHSRLAMYEFFNPHFRLGVRTPITEREFILEGRDDLTVWTPEHPRPDGWQAAEAHEQAVRAWMSAQDERNIAPLLTDASAGRLREVVGKAWEIMIGRPVPGRRDIEMSVSSTVEAEDHTRMVATIRHIPSGDVVPCTFLFPKQGSKRMVVWLSLNEAASVVTANGLTRNGRELLQAGVAIAAPELYMSGAAETPPVGYIVGQEPPNWKGRRSPPLRGDSQDPDDSLSFSGYTYGYNPTLLARRVHDVLAVAVAGTHFPGRASRQLHVAGVGGAAAVAAAAVMMMPDEVGRLAVDTQGFDFEQIVSHRDPNFVPGAVKYGGMSALLRLCEPAQVIRAESTAAVVDRMLD